MFAVLLVLFIVVPLVEIAVIVQVAQAVGGWNTVGILLLLTIQWIAGWTQGRWLRGGGRRG